MRILLVIFWMIGGHFTALWAQEYTISGYVTDASSGEVLIGANVYDQNTMQGTATNNYGFFSLTLPEGEVVFTISFVGYPTYIDTFVLQRDTQMSLPLTSSFDLDAVEVKATKVSRIEEQSQMSTVEIPVAQIKQLPAFLGEVDVLKTLQLLPGVQSGNEGATGLFVRGGSPDQNLILLDGVPVYNVSHLFGFFSVFNADALNSVKLIKGGFPARYGGRLSSVLEIQMKEGHKKEWHGDGSIGIIASKLTLEGPLIKDKASILVSGRRTYIDLLAQPFIKAGFASDNSSGSAGYYFYDLNGKINYTISEKDRLYLSAYLGDDRFYFRERYEETEPGYSLEEEFGGALSWGNVTSVLRWNHQYSPKLFSNATVYYSQYQFNTGVEDGFREVDDGVVEEEFFGLRYFSGIDDWSGKVDFDWLPSPDHFVRFGASGIYHTFRPGATQFEADFGNNTLDTTIGSVATRAGEYRVYIEDDWKVNQRLKVNAGLHGSAFAVDGRWYWDIEPRLSMRYLLTDEMSLKASYARMSQYIHLLTNSGVGLPTDLWVPATDRVPPQRSWQVAAGLARTLGNQFEVTLEGYYKVMQNVIEYRDGASYLGNANNWEGQVASGRGWSYGAELLVQKKTGATTGWVGYTLSWTNRQFAELNFGETFPYKFDRRHDLSIAIVHEINDRWQVSGTFVYGTGNAISLPIAQYGGITGSATGEVYSAYAQRFHYASRNGFRMRAYHRMDLGITHTKTTKWGESRWNLSVYNLYSRLNPYFIYYGTDDFGDPAFKQVSLFPILPSISYAFSF